MNDFPQTLIDKLRAARHVTVLTGAGVSAESGIPTFRDAQTGLWTQYDPQQLATPQAFRQNPQLVWDWYAWRRGLVEQCAPNPGHDALVALAERVPRLTLITQNIDGLHQQAGSRDVIELHGNLARYKCFEHGHPAAPTMAAAKEPPRCARCGSLLRPDVVWFGEGLNRADLERALVAAIDCDLFFSIGTSGEVFPAAQLPLVALERGAYVVEVNPIATPLTSLVDVALAAPSGALLPRLLAAAWPPE